MQAPQFTMQAPQFTIQAEGAANSQAAPQTRTTALKACMQQCQGMLAGHTLMSVAYLSYIGCLRTASSGSVSDKRKIAGVLGGMGPEATVDFTASHARASGTHADVAREEDMNRVFGDLGQRSERLEVLVNNAGIAGPTACVEDIDPDVCPLRVRR